MTRPLLTIILVSFSSLLMAQSDEIQLIERLYGMEKKEIVDDFINIENQEAGTDFWTLYEEYENARKSMGSKRLELLNSYVTNYDGMTEDQMTGLLTDVSKLNTDYQKLMAKYAKKISKKVGVKPAAQFYQLESYLNNSINASIAEEIPFIGELDE